MTVILRLHDGYQRTMIVLARQMAAGQNRREFFRESAFEIQSKDDILEEYN
jgi:hypothetical protein